METKTYPFELTKELTDTGEFEGYASTWDEDQMGDRIMPGAFKRTLNSWSAKGRPIPVLWQHHADEPIGATMEIDEDERGLRVKGRLLMGIGRAREAYEAAKAKILGGLSIGFSIPKDGADWSDDGSRTIREIKLFEYSLVTFPANEGAVVTGVKGDDPTLREIADLLADIRRELRYGTPSDGTDADPPSPAPGSSRVDTLIAEIRRQRTDLTT